MARFRLSKTFRVFGCSSFYTLSYEKRCYYQLEIFSYETMNRKSFFGKSQVTKEDLLNDQNNPGLDADHSSSDSKLYAGLNNDNDRVSSNTDGEQDTEEYGGYTPLEDK